MESLVAELNLGDSVAGQKIQVEMNIELLRIDRELLTPLALFALEALEKSRERLSAGGRIFILLQSVAGLATMVITGSDSLAAFKSRGELGLTLMQAYARQLQGETTFATTPQGGLTITLTFPVGI